MDYSNIQRALNTEPKETFSVREDLESFLYIVGVLIAGLYHLWVLKREVEGSRASPPPGPQYRPPMRKQDSEVYVCGDCKGHVWSNASTKGEKTRASACVWK